MKYDSMKQDFIKRRRGSMKATENGKPRTAEEVIKAYAARIGEIEAELAAVTEEKELLESRLASFAKGGASTGEAVVHRGKEHDLYPGEIREVVLDVLRKAAENTQDGTRRADILQDVLESNDFEDAPRRRAKELKTAVKSYSGMTSAVKKKLHDLGIDPDPKVSKHIKVTYYGDQRYTATLTSSGSDSRCGGKNLAADLIQRFF